MTRTICTYVRISILFVEFWYKQCHIAACKMVDYTDSGKCRCKTSKETFNVASAYEQFQQRWWNRQARSTGPQLTHHTTHFTCRFQHWQMAVLLVLCRHYLCPFSLTGVSATTPENLVPRLPYHPGGDSTSRSTDVYPITEGALQWLLQYTGMYILNSPTTTSLIRRSHSLAGSTTASWCSSFRWPYGRSLVFTMQTGWLKGNKHTLSIMNQTIHLPGPMCSVRLL